MVCLPSSGLAAPSGLRLGSQMHSLASVTVDRDGICRMNDGEGGSRPRQSNTLGSRRLPGSPSLHDHLKDSEDSKDAMMQ